MGQHGSKWPTRDAGFVALLKRYKLWILAVLALAAAAALLGCGPQPANGQRPPAAPKRVAIAGPAGVLSALAPGDTLNYSASWQSCGRCTRYRFTVVASGSSGWTGLPTGQVTSATAMNFKAINLSAWDSVRFKASLWAEDAAGRPSRDTSRAEWSLVRGPGSPGPIIIDSSQVQLSMLDTVGLEATLAIRDLAPSAVVARHWVTTGEGAGGVDLVYLDAAPASLPATARNLSLCLVKVLPGRKVGQRSGSSARCVTALQLAFPVEHRTLTAAEQAAIDSAIGKQDWEVPPSWTIHFRKQARDSLIVVPSLEARAEREARTWLALAGR